MDDRTRILLRRATSHRAAPDAASRWVPAGVARAGRGAAVAGTARPPRVLALVEPGAHDRQVVETARALAGSDRPTIVLLHVARPVLPIGATGAWERMAAVEARAQRTLRRLAARLLPPGILVHTAVRFGDAVEQVAKAAVAVDATVVVARSRPARWLWWRDRDRRFRRRLPTPVVLVPSEPSARPMPRESSAPSGRRAVAGGPGASTPDGSRLSA
jgi:hypothetical protein